MKTATELKHFFRDRLGIKGIRVKTGTGKGLWQGVWLKFEDPQIIPLDFRVACLKIIYPTSPNCWSGSAGNVERHSISMHQHEWEKVIAQWEQRLTPAAAVINYSHDMKQPLEIKVNPETPAYVTWLAAVREMCRAYMAEHYPNLPGEVLEPLVGSRYIKIMRRSAKIDPDTGRPNHSSAWAFIDRTNGDVLKAASWAAPAKIARGNIFDDKNGLGSMSNSGPAYLR